MSVELAIGGLGLGLQILDGFVQLHGFCKKVKEAPQDLRDLESRHAQVTSIVRACKAQYLKDKLENDDLLSQEALKICQDELERLAKLTEELTPEPSARWWRRKQKAIKAVLEEGALEKCRKRLGEDLIMLLVARL